MKIYKLHNIPPECISMIKHFVATKYLPQLELTCNKVKVAELSKQEISARKCGYYDSSVKNIFESKKFKCGHVKCLKYLKSVVPSYETFLNYIRSQNNNALIFAA